METKMKIYVPPTEQAGRIAQSLDRQIAQLEVTEHPFLKRFRKEGMSHEQLREFSPQWYHVITAHKHAFAGLIYNTQDENLRADLTAILYDECGAGDPDNMHTKLWLKVPEAIGLTKDQVLTTAELAEVKQFGDYVGARWGNSNHSAENYGLVFLFEKIGADFHQSFLNGLEKSRLPENALNYSRLHTVAEEEHAKRIVNGLVLYGQRIDEMKTGIEGGARVMNQLWDGFQKVIYK